MTPLGVAEAAPGKGEEVRARRRETEGDVYLLHSPDEGRRSEGLAVEITRERERESVCIASRAATELWSRLGHDNTTARALSPSLSCPAALARPHPLTCSSSHMQTHTFPQMRALPLHSHTITYLRL